MFRVILTYFPVESVVDTRKEALVDGGNCDIKGTSDGTITTLWISLPIHEVA